MPLKLESVPPSSIGPIDAWPTGNLLPNASFEVPSISLAKEAAMHGIIYLVGLVVVILAVLSFFGLR